MTRGLSCKSKMIDFHNLNFKLQRLPNLIEYVRKLLPTEFSRYFQEPYDSFFKYFIKIQNGGMRKTTAKFQILNCYNSRQGGDIKKMDHRDKDNGYYYNCTKFHDNQMNNTEVLSIFVRKIAFSANAS